MKRFEKAQNVSKSIFMNFFVPLNITTLRLKNTFLAVIVLPD